MIQRVGKLDLGKNELSSFGCDDKVREQCKLHSNPNGVTSDAGDDRLRKTSKCVQQRDNAFIDRPMKASGSFFRR